MGVAALQPRSTDDGKCQDRRIKGYNISDCVMMRLCSAITGIMSDLVWARPGLGQTFSRFVDIIVPSSCVPGLLAEMFSQETCDPCGLSLKRSFGGAVPTDSQLEVKQIVLTDLARE